MYFQIAQALNRIGYTVIRTDLSGMGESDGNIEDISFSDHVLDLEAIVGYVLQRKDICPTGRIHLIGHCIGCCTALKVGSSLSRSLESITLLSPFIPSPQSHMAMLGVENYYAITKNGFGYRKGVYCCNSFLSAAYILKDPAMMDMLHSMRTNIVFSQCDEFSAIRDSIHWGDSIPASYKIIDDANHNYIGPLVRRRLLEYISNLFSDD